MNQRSAALLVFLLGSVAAFAQEDPCQAKILNVSVGWGAWSGDPSSFEAAVSHNGVAALRWTWRGGSFSSNNILYNPQPITLNVECLLDLAELVVTPVKCGIAGQQHTQGVPPPDTQPAIKSVMGLNDQYEAVIRYWFPNTPSRRLRAVLLPAGRILKDRSWFETVVEGATAVQVSGSDDGEVLVKAYGCPTRTAKDTFTVQQDKCKCDDQCAEVPECVADPVNTYSGTMRYEDGEPLPANPFLPLRRIYLSRSEASGFFGPRWFSAFDANLRVFDDIDGLRYVTVTTEQRERLIFEGRGRVLRADRP